MKIELQEGLTVRDLVAGYENNDERGVVAFGGELDVRPAYQREFVYKDKQRDAVIETVTKSFPLNVMYWSACEDGRYEIIDGQQRTISLCEYVSNQFTINNMFFKNLPNDRQEQILSYELMVYVCSGDDSERLDWFRTINIAGEKLTEQELRNATYHGPWTADAKRQFSKPNCKAQEVGSAYLNGSAIRQDYLETAIEWINDGKVDDYMARNQDAPNANELWLHFQSVIAWVKATFPEYRKEMKGLNWGELYAAHSGWALDSVALGTEIARLMADGEVTAKKGIYAYVLSGETKYLNLRQFAEWERRGAYERQKGICPSCAAEGKPDAHHELAGMHADHIIPWHKGGKTVEENCQMLCAFHNSSKGGR